MSVYLNHFLPLQLSLIQEQLFMNSLSGPAGEQTRMKWCSLYRYAKPWQPIPLRKGIISRMCENELNRRNKKK